MRFLLFFLLFAKSYGYNDVVDEVEQPKVVGQNVGSSPYSACQVLKTPLVTDPVLLKIKTNKYYGDLQKRVLDSVKDNVKISEYWTQCYKKDSKVFSTSGCANIRYWHQPKIYPKPKDYEESFIYKHFQGQSFPSILGRARTHLAIATPRNSPSMMLHLNSNLKTFGYKDTAWQPINDTEKRAAQKRLESYISEVRDSLNLTSKQFEALAIPHPKAMGPIGVRSNPMYPSEGELAHQILQRRAVDMLTAKRRGHLINYRMTLEHHRIINFLSSPEPDDDEYLEALAKLKRNGELEVQKIRQIRVRNELNPDFIPQQSEDLLLYTSIVREFLKENPEHCQFATTEYHRTNTRKRIFAKVKFGLHVGPVLAAVILAPPIGAAMIAGGIGGVSWFSSYLDLSATKRSAYSAPVSTVSVVSSQADVNQALSEFYGEGLILPLEFVGAGLTAKGVRKIRSKFFSKEK